MIMKIPLLSFIIGALVLLSCKNNGTNEKEEVLSLFDVVMQGKSQDEIIRALIERTIEFDYFNDDKTDINRVILCGVPCGLNVESEQKDGTTIITRIMLLTSQQSKTAFDAIKKGISMRYGEPDFEDGESEELDGRYYGKCVWKKGDVILRNVHSDEGGLFLFLTSSVNNK